MQTRTKALLLIWSSKSKLMICYCRVWLLIIYESRCTEEVEEPFLLVFLHVEISWIYPEMWMAGNTNKCRRIVPSLSASGGCGWSCLPFLLLAIYIEWNYTGNVFWGLKHLQVSELIFFHNTYALLSFWGCCIDADVLISAASPVLCNAKHLPFVFPLTWIASIFFPHDHLSAFLTLCVSPGITKQSKYFFFTWGSVFSYILLPSKADFGMYFYIINHFLWSFKVAVN